jgi:Nif-specific regulatory protein
MEPEKTIRLQRENFLYEKKEPSSRLPIPPERFWKNWRMLLEISTSLQGFHSIHDLQKHLMENIFQMIPAEEGIFLVGEELAIPESVYSAHHLNGPGGIIQISRTVAQQVFEEGTPLMSNDVSSVDVLRDAKSLIHKKVRSVLCAPLRIGEKFAGLIYLDSKQPDRTFEEDHLQLLAALAGIASTALSNLRYLQGLKDENRRLREEIVPAHGMIGESAAIQEIAKFISRAAPTDSTVLITGESGTGKELVARAIHQNSRRSEKPFVVINSAVLTETLLESELFGHEKGAFTGAIAQKKGRLEIADTGTLFLDEMGELAPDLQAKLLRFLQHREFERVGSNRPIKVDVRIIAATNKDLETAIQNGTFRQDLYYRLNVLSICMPPLRNRKEDIPLLANYFILKSGEKIKRKIMGMTAEARDALLSYDWPGNIRELENTIERAAVLGSDEWIRNEDLPESLIEQQPEQSSAISNYQEALLQMKKDLIQKAFQQAGGVYTETAKILGVHVNYLHRLIRNLHLKDQLKKP